MFRRVSQFMRGPLALLLALPAALAAWTFPVRASDPVPAVAQGVGDPLSPWSHPFLWIIEGEKPSYLFGTIHLADERISGLPGFVADTISRCDGAFTEISFGAGSMGEATKGSLLQGKEGLRDLLPPVLWRRLDRYLEKRSLSARAFERFKIWNVASTVELLDTLKGGRVQLGLDMRIFGRALAEGKEVGGIETVEEQLSVFDTMSLGEQIDYLSSIVDRLEEADRTGEKPLDELFDLYVKGDLEDLQAMILEQYAPGDPSAAQMFDRLITTRNRRMADRIAEKIAENPGRGYFFAMGAAHFLPSGGVQTLLQEKGLAVRRIGKDD